MGDGMLHAVLNMPLPDDPSEIDLVTWVQFKGRAREASARIADLSEEIEDMEEEVNAPYPAPRMANEINLLKSCIAELEVKLSKARDDALEEAACLCERTEMGIGTKAGGKYISGPSVCFELGSGTHPGMGYADNLRALKGEQNDD